MEEIKFGISINPEYVPEGREAEFKNKYFMDYIMKILPEYNLKVMQTLRFMGEYKLMLSGEYQDIKNFLQKEYGYVDYSCIYLWNARCVELINNWKTLPRPSLEMWRLL